MQPSGKPLEHTTGKKVRAKRMTILRYLRDFSDNTTLHGIRYIGEPNRHWLERLCWFAIVVVCTSGCIFYILNLLHRWNSSPVIVTFAERSTPIWNIPFPAVTICPDNKVPRSKFDIANTGFNSYVPSVYESNVAYTRGILLNGTLNGTNYLGMWLSSNYTFPQSLTNYSAFPSNQFWNASNYFDSGGNGGLSYQGGLYNTYNDSLTKPSYPAPFGLDEANNVSANESMEWQAISMMCGRMKHDFLLNRSHVEKFIELSTTIEHLPFCRWRSETSNCSRLFRPIITDEGVCFTFNMMDNEHFFTSETELYDDMLEDTTERKAEMMGEEQGWDPDEGYHQGVGEEAYPWRVRGRGTISGLDVLMLSTTKELQPNCWSNAKSYKILLHSPSDFPKVSDQHFRIPVNSLVSVAIKPIMVTTSRALGQDFGYTPKVRGCYFPEERHLTFFQVYTQRNCETECLANRIKLMCGCTPFFLPRLKTESTIYCSSSDAECMQNSEYDLANSAESEARKGSSMPDMLPCDCLPSCTEYKYDMEISNTQIDRDELATYVDDPELNQREQSRISVYFKDSQFITSQRREQYGLIDFIANCGGLLGLFTGFSLISAVEILYYATVRLCCHLSRHRKGGAKV